MSHCPIRLCMQGLKIQRSGVCGPRKLLESNLSKYIVRIIALVLVYLMME